MSGIIWKVEALPTPLARNSSRTVEKNPAKLCACRNHIIRAIAGGDAAGQHHQAREQTAPAKLIGPDAKHDHDSAPSEAACRSAGPNCIFRQAQLIFERQANDGKASRPQSTP
jgi:hypothetical protein